MGFQNTLNNALPVGVEGDFASTNPYHTLLSAGEAQYKAGISGVTVGRFAWVDPATGLATNVKGALTLLGFVGRNGLSVLENGQEASMLVRSGRELSLFDKGDFWGRFASGATIGQNVFANNTDGSLAAATPATLADHTPTGFTIGYAAGAGELAKITK